MKTLIIAIALFVGSYAFAQSNQVATCLIGFTINITNANASVDTSADGRTITISIPPQPTPTVVGQAVLECNSGKLCGSASQPGNCSPGNSYDIVVPANTIQITIHYFAVDACCSLAEEPSGVIHAVDPCDPT